MICFVMKMSSTYYDCCIYLKDSNITLNTEANDMLGGVRYGSLLFTIKATKVHQKMRKQPTIVVNSGKGVKLLLKLGCILMFLNRQCMPKPKKMTYPHIEYVFLVHGKH